MTDKKKFTASFSTGKDCTLAIYKAIKVGYEPAGLITTRNTDGKIAWFHQLLPERAGPAFRLYRYPYISHAHRRQRL